MELQTMPLRFRVWCVSKNNFITMEDVFSPQNIREERRNETELSLRWFAKFIACITSVSVLNENEYIISQDTGFKDKNGKSIFIGDIVRHNNRYSIPAGVVQYNKHSSKVVFNEFNDGLYNSHKLIEVVGNIWQNPEMVENSDASR